MTTAPYEKPTDDLRQVRHAKWAGDHLLVYYSVQRRWVVSAGDAYSSPTCNNPTDLKVGPWHPIQGDWFGFRFQPAKSEWRDLPEVRADQISTQPTSTTK